MKGISFIWRMNIKYCTFLIFFQKHTLSGLEHYITILLLLRSDRKELSSESNNPNYVQTIWRYLFRLFVDGATPFCFSIKMILFFSTVKKCSCNFSSSKIFLVFYLSPELFLSMTKTLFPVVKIPASWIIEETLNVVYLYDTPVLNSVNTV